MFIHSEKHLAEVFLGCKHDESQLKVLTCAYDMFESNSKFSQVSEKHKLIVGGQICIIFRLSLRTVKALPWELITRVAEPLPV